MWEEFKEFALKGNALSLAIGVIIGAAFGKIVDALVSDIIMPVIGIAGKADFSNYYVPLSSNVTAQPSAAKQVSAGESLARKLPRRCKPPGGAPWQCHRRFRCRSESVSSNTEVRSRDNGASTPRPRRSYQRPYPCP